MTGSNIYSVNFDKMKSVILNELGDKYKSRNILHEDELIDIIRIEAKTLCKEILYRDDLVDVYMISARYNFIRYSDILIKKHRNSPLEEIIIIIHELITEDEIFIELLNKMAIDKAKLNQYDRIVLTIRDKLLINKDVFPANRIDSITMAFHKIVTKLDDYIESIRDSSMDDITHNTSKELTISTTLDDAITNYKEFMLKCVLPTEDDIKTAIDKVAVSNAVLLKEKDMIPKEEVLSKALEYCSCPTYLWLALLLVNKKDASLIEAIVELIMFEREHNN